ncbi:hypothetical protein T492DRAFT_960614 [Pavlovales sp. CCMP2436]|nr:hypothetical protein T492DRAFT_960614 [Pavlovales sp. CCMP2436]
MRAEVAVSRQPSVGSGRQNPSSARKQSATIPSPRTVPASAQPGNMRRVAVVSHPDCLVHLSVVPFAMREHLRDSPARLNSVLQSLRELGAKVPLSWFTTQEDIAPLKESDLLAVHSSAYVQRCEQIESALAGPSDLMALDSGAETFIGHGSINAARGAAASVCQAVDLVMDPNHEASVAFCAVRPPGHHAGFEGEVVPKSVQSLPKPVGCKNARGLHAGQGFCIFNSCAIGAQHAHDTWGVERVAVIDFDVHHGNGTEDVLRGKEWVLCASIHGVDHTFYPFSGLEKAAEGVVNVPIRKRSSSFQFVKPFREVLLPVVREFNPQLIIVAAGFDAHQDDPLGNQSLSYNDFFEMTSQIVLLARECCEGRIVSVLEGGYKSDDLAKCVTEHVKALAGAQIDEHQTRGSVRPMYAQPESSPESSPETSDERPMSSRFGSKRPRDG